jgi:hypothetical protein
MELQFVTQITGITSLATGSTTTDVAVEASCTLSLTEKGLYYTSD